MDTPSNNKEEPKTPTDQKTRPVNKQPERPKRKVLTSREKLVARRLNFEYDNDDD